MPHAVWNSPACLQLWHWSPKAITKGTHSPATVLLEVTPRDEQPNGRDAMAGLKTAAAPVVKLQGGCWRHRSWEGR